MKIRKARSISKAFDIASYILSKWHYTSPYFWFRGVNNRNLKLVPGAYWRKKYDEYAPLVSFAQESSSFKSDYSDVKSWDFYYFAQHNGIPTRLLDWTESFSSALFFALETPKSNAVPCVWIMDPCSYNEAIMNWYGIFAPENYEEADIWLPHLVKGPQALVKQDLDGWVYNNLHPVAIYPKRSNPRISNQQGYFTVHGSDRRSLDEILSSLGHSSGDVFARIDLEGIDRKKALEQLSLLGVRRSAIFPDITNLVAQLKEYYEWK
ncbi:FRG domain protein [Polystyrenella longa]|uniref:FRG domain protein n=1 Tax=Polystyrenella longa TaxID=2528007 RepID=A0A518CLT0_9PLAN|nr:FRG domain-containing protein [Polystyrenella longa]QDU80199.1 FRG domain protein [Polystyrenella longa]